MQRNFDPVRQQVESWRAQQLSAEQAKLTIYRAFIEGDLEVPRHLVRRVHELYLNPQHEEFQPRTMWNLCNAFTSAFNELDPIPQFKATAKLGEFLEARALHNRTRQRGGADQPPSCDGNDCAKGSEFATT